MKLTPIRVRGKRGQPKPRKRTRGQEGKDGAGAYGGGQQQPEKKRARKHHGKGDDDARARRARLQQLPHEILERVFIASQNLCLPLVSRELYHMLSSDSIKYRLVGAAFGPTWDAYYGCDNFEIMSYDGWQSDAERIEGDPTFQSAVLACSWAKLPMLLTSFDVWIRQQSRGRVYFRIPELKQDRLQMAPQPGSLYERAYIDGETDDGDGDGDGGDTASSSTMGMREKLAFDLAGFEALISRSSSAAGVPPGQIPLRGNTYHLRAMLGMHLEVHPGTRIPSDLLSGPFESDGGAIGVGTEKMQRLFWLVRGGARLQEDQTWEVTREGFRRILQLIITAGAGSPAGGGDGDGDDDDDDDHEQDGPSTSSSRSSTAADDDRLELAARLLALFDLLGVFDAQLYWPRYIVHTTLAQVSALIPHAAPSSGREALLGGAAALLRQGQRQQYEGCATAVYRHLGGRWRRPPPGGRHAAALYGRNVHAVAFARVWRDRACLFLGVPAGEGLPASGAVGNAPVMHEPWSDFGLD